MAGLWRRGLILLGFVAALAAFGGRMLNRGERRRAARAAPRSSDPAAALLPSRAASPSPPEPADAPPPAPRQCNLTRGLVIGDKVIARPAGVSSPGECCARCWERRRCRAFSFVAAGTTTNRDHQGCKLLANDRVVGRAPVPDWTAGTVPAIREGALEAEWNRAPNCSFLPGRVLGKQTLGWGQTTQSAGDCCELCAQDPRCQAFTFDEEAHRRGAVHTCYLKADSLDAGDAVPLRISGVLHWRPPPAPTPAPTPAPPPPPTPAPSPMLPKLERQAKRGFHGVVSIREGFSECGIRDGAAWVAQKGEVAALGPLLHRGGCRWSLAGAAWCTPPMRGVTFATDWLCAWAELDRKLRRLSNGTLPPCPFSSSREAPQPADSGALEVVRTPRSAPLLALLREEWPLRIDWCGDNAAWGGQGLAVEEDTADGSPGSWWVPEAAVGHVAAQIVGRSTPYVAIALERAPRKWKPGTKNKIRQRYRVTAQQKLVHTEGVVVHVWSGLAGNESAAVEGLLRDHLHRDRRAATLGLDIAYELRNSSGAPFPPKSCKHAVTGPVVLLPPTRNHRLVAENLGHWSYEALYVLHSARVRPGEAVALWLTDQWEAWMGIAGQHEELRRAVTQLAPVQHKLAVGICLAKARLHTTHGGGFPGQGAYRGLRRYLRRALSLPPEPVGVPRQGELTAALLLRRPAGSRYIANWPALAAEARALGWALQLPLKPDDPGGISMPRRLMDVVAAVARSHAVIAIHGAELSVGAFAVPAGSVLVEICTGGPFMRFIDLWFASYAFSADVHVVRWVLPANRTAHTPGQGVRWPPQGWSALAHGPLPGAEAPPEARFPVHDWVRSREAVKLAPSSTVLPPDGWRRLLTRLRRLLELQGQGSAPPLTVRNVPAEGA